VRVADLDSEIAIRVGRAEPDTVEVPASDNHVTGRTVGIRQAVHDLLLASFFEPVAREYHPDESSSHRGCAAVDRDTAQDAGYTTEKIPTSPAQQLLAVSPGRQLAGHCGADTDQPRSIRQLCNADILRLHAQARIAEQFLGLFDTLPAFLDRRQIPARAERTDRPQAALPGVERQLPADGERLERLVCAERCRAEDAVAVHAPIIRESVERLQS
jgi:hypothetical protein